MNLHKLMKQAQQMQNKIASVQEEVAKKTVEGAAGGGTVKCVASGDGKLVSIEISPEVISADDRDMLQDLVLAAVNNALENAKAMSQEEMKKVAGGMNIPGMDGLF